MRFKRILSVALVCAVMISCVTNVAATQTNEADSFVVHSTELSVIEYSGSYRTGSSIGNNVREIGYKWNSKVKLRDSADCIGFQSTVITHDSTQARSVSTIAAARWEFDVYFGEATGTPKYSGVTITPNFAYLVNV